MLYAMASEWGAVNAPEAEAFLAGMPSNILPAGKLRKRLLEIIQQVPR
jgi:hypothetical protein